jgi:nitrogen fixation protein NifU and related proteins
MSMLAEDLTGKTVAEIDALTQENIKEMLGVPVGPRRFKCALLCLHTLKNALRQHRGLPLQSWAETAQ